MPRPKDQPKDAAEGTWRRRKMGATPAQIASLAYGREVKRKIRAENAGDKRDRAPERWRKLMQGEITMADLDDEEVARRKVRAKDGTFAGPYYAMTGPWHDKFIQEQLRRSRRKINDFVGEGLDILIDIARSNIEAESDPRVSADVIKYLLNHALGKAPETVTVREEDPWERVIAEALEDNRNMDEEAPQPTKRNKS